MTPTENQNYNLETLSDAEMQQIAYQLNAIEPSSMTDVAVQSAGFMHGMEGDSTMMIAVASVALLLTASVVLKRLKAVISA